jgi:hypothetical protein
MKAGSAVIYNSDTIKPDAQPEGVQFCPLPVNQLSNASRSKVEQNTHPQWALDYPAYRWSRFVSGIRL